MFAFLKWVFPNVMLHFLVPMSVIIAVEGILGD